MAKPREVIFRGTFLSRPKATEDGKYHNASICIWMELSIDFVYLLNVSSTLVSILLSFGHMSIIMCLCGTMHWSSACYEWIIIIEYVDYDFLLWYYELLRFC